MKTKAEKLIERVVNESGNPMVDNCRECQATIEELEMHFGNADWDDPDYKPLKRDGEHTRLHHAQDQGPIQDQGD